MMSDDVRYGPMGWDKGSGGAPVAPAAPAASYAHQPPAPDNSGGGSARAVDPNEGVSAYHIVRRSSSGGGHEIVGKAKTIKSARMVKDRRDTQYGAAVHSIKEHPSGRTRI